MMIDLPVSYGAAIAVKATLLLSVAFGLGFLFRRASASARHFLWARSRSRSFSRSSR